MYCSKISRENICTIYNIHCSDYIVHIHTYNRHKVEHEYILIIQNNFIGFGRT